MMTQALDSYLAVRRAAGFKLKKVEYYLRSFVQFSSNEGQAYISAQTAIEWARQGTSPAQRSFRLKTVACFARYVSAEDAQHEVPPDDIFGGYQIRRRIPFIFTVVDVNRLVETASLLGPPGALRRHTYSTIFALLSVTGMRISEALNLRFEDVTADGISIRNTKFGKSRFIPLHPTAVAGLEKYLVQRRRVVGADSHVFVSIRGRKLAHSVVHYEFQKWSGCLNSTLGRANRILVSMTCGIRLPPGHWSLVRKGVMRSRATWWLCPLTSVTATFGTRTGTSKQLPPF